VNRKQITLLLLVVLATAVGYAWIATPKQRRVAPGQNIQHQKKLQQQVTETTLSTIADIDLFGGKKNQYQNPRKNLFAPLYPPSQVMNPPSISYPIKKTTRPAQKIQKNIQPQDQNPIPPLDVLGYLNKKGDYTVFLSSKAGEIYLVKIGKIFAGDLIIRDISDKSIVVGRQGTDQEIILPQSIAKSQRLPKVGLQSGRPKFEIPKDIFSQGIVKPQQFPKTGFQSGRPKSEMQKKLRMDKQKKIEVPAFDNAGTTGDIFKPYMGDK